MEYEHLFYTLRSIIKPSSLACSEPFEEVSLKGTVNIAAPRDAFIRLQALKLN